jgi:hypothetical protein
MEGLIMNSKKDYNSFFSFLLGKELLTKKVYIEDKKLVIDEKGNISINYSNPTVLKGIGVRMKEFENIPLSRDIKTDAGIA